MASAQDNSLNGSSCLDSPSRKATSFAGLKRTRHGGDSCNEGRCVETGDVHVGDVVEVGKKIAIIDTEERDLLLK